MTLKLYQTSQTIEIERSALSNHTVSHVCMNALDISKIITRFEVITYLNQYEAYDYDLDRNGSRPIGAACTTTSPHVPQWSSETVLFSKSPFVANKTFGQHEL